MPNQTINIVSGWRWYHYVILAGIIFLIFMVWKGCDTSRSANERYATMQAKADSLEQALAEKTKWIKYSDSLDAQTKLRAKAARDSVERIADSARKQLKAEQSKSMRYYNQWQYAREGLPDTGYVYVSQKYIEACDDCCGEVPVLNKRIDDLAFADSSKDALMAYEWNLSAAREVQLIKQRDSAMLLAKLNNELAKGAVNDAQPRTKGYVVASLGYLPVTGIYAGGGFTIANKKGTMFTFKTLYDPNPSKKERWGGQFEVHQKLSLRKK